MSERTKLQHPGIYPATVRWAGTTEIGANQTPAFKLLLAAEQFIAVGEKVMRG